MTHSFSQLTVYFEDPFWVGVLERESAGRCEVCKITFGAEPKDSDVYDSFPGDWRSLRFSSSVESEGVREIRNSKRLQREIRRAVQSVGVGTKAQQALKLQQEHGKLERKIRSRRQREEEAERQFALRQEKRREKHRGH